jgi:hypothetical protein
MKSSGEAQSKKDLDTMSYATYRRNTYDKYLLKLQLGINKLPRMWFVELTVVTFEAIFVVRAAPTSIYPSHPESAKSIIYK